MKTKQSRQKILVDGVLVISRIAVANCAVSIQRNACQPT